MFSTVTVYQLIDNLVYINRSNGSWALPITCGVQYVMLNSTVLCMFYHQITGVKLALCHCH